MSSVQVAESSHLHTNTPGGCVGIQVAYIPHYDWCCKFCQLVLINENNTVNPLTPRIDQHINSPYNFNTMYTVKQTGNEN